MSLPLYVAFIWHQHQPFYKSPLVGKYRMPWVRLHGVKDYLDFMLVLEKFPQLHQTVNLSPSLIVQLQDYIDGVAFDPYLELTLTPTANLNQSQKTFIIEHFFDANHHTMVGPFPRYARLLDQKKSRGTTWCLHHWTLDDYDDLLAWHNLVWIDPLFRETDLQIQQWFDRGRGFTLGDRQLIYSKQREILAQILPQYRKMQQQGQIEVMTSPYAHPILPLLADCYVARQSSPQMILPGVRFRWESDISLHLEKGRSVYQQCFGREPRGLWPPEQSVSPAILPHVARHGFQWLCADEAVLGLTLGHYFQRDQFGRVTQPQLLYQPYRLETVYGDLAIAFRDRRLSDLISFSYSAMSAKAASEDLCGHLQRIYEQFCQRDEERPWLVTIALDGENCWEYYSQDGREFLETLYSDLGKVDFLKLVTVPEYTAEFPPVERIPPHQLHSGSWVEANFTSWIGETVKNRAWELLTEARQMLSNHPEATLENNPEVWENLLAAEGSDWFWWLGEGHHSNNDYLFELLFREHLQALYRLLNETIPASLQYPLEPLDLPQNHQPERMIHPKIDGHANEQDWQGAGCIEIEFATSHQIAPERLWYGCDHFHFYLRLDFKDPRSKLLPTLHLPTLHLFWFYPDKKHFNSTIPLKNIPNVTPLNYLFHHHLAIDPAARGIWMQQARASNSWQNVPTQAKMMMVRSLEVSLPWQDLAVNPQSHAMMVVLLSQGGLYQASLPEYTIIPIEVP